MSELSQREESIITAGKAFHWFYGEERECKGENCFFCIMEQDINNSQERIVGKTMQQIEASLPENKQQEAFKNVIKDILYDSCHDLKQVMFSHYAYPLPKGSGYAK